MNIAVANPARGSAAASERVQTRLVHDLVEAGYARVEPPILQQASTFLDLGGEHIRARLFLISDRSDAELCLRPEYTIPVCRAYLGSAEAGQVASYSYCGRVFRAGSEGGGELLQAGLESFGRADVPAADAEILALTLDSVHRASGAVLPRIALGDVGLFDRVLETLEMPVPWRRRLKRGLERGAPVDSVLMGAPTGADERTGVMAALAGVDGRDARALIEDLLSIAGIAPVGGRTVSEIADRFLAQAAQKSVPGFGGERRAVLDRFLRISGDLDESATAVRALARDAQLDLGTSLDLFEARTGFIAAHGVDLDRLTFRAAFARNLDYYTGFVFEGFGAAGGEDLPLFGGGRYDRLAQALGSRRPVPAVGAAIWVDRLPAPELGS